MWTCIKCKFEVPLDDAVTPVSCGRCICLRCWATETATTHPMPNGLRRQMVAVLAAQGEP